MRPKLRSTALLLTLLAAAAGAAHAQLWRGPAALEVRAEAQGGKGAAGAEVRLLYLALEPPDGPAPVVLDSRGRVVVGGLAEGTWRLEVAREGYMTYRAEVEVREGDKPRVLAAGQHNVPGAVHTMSVRLARARGGPPAPAPVVAAAPGAPPPPPPAPARAAPPASPPRESAAGETPEEEAARSPAAPAPAGRVPQPQAQPPAPAAPIAPPPPAAAPPSAPSAAPPTRPAPPPPAATPPSPPTQPASPAPRPATPPVPAPHPAADQPKPAAPAPPAPAPPAPAVPAPPAVAPPAAAVPVTAAPPPAPAPRVLRRSYQDGTCADCRPSETALSAEVVAAPAAAGSPGCEAALRQALAQARTGPAAALAATLPPSCPLVEVRLPAGGRYTGYRFEAGDESGEADCLAGRECPIGQCLWTADPALLRSADGAIITAAFENRSPARARRAVLTVYFTVGTAAGTRR